MEFERYSRGGRAFQEKGISMCKLRDYCGHGDVHRECGACENWKIDRCRVGVWSCRVVGGPQKLTPRQQGA